MKYIVSKSCGDLPVLIYIHGGPGFPDYFFFESLQKKDSTFNQFNLEKVFKVFYVELRGAGRGYKESKLKLTFEKQVEDVIDLAEKLNLKYGSKVYLMGHSWGSFIGLKSVYARPDLFEKYIGVGQIINYPKMVDIAFDKIKSLILNDNSKTFKSKEKELQKIDFICKRAWFNEYLYEKTYAIQNKYINKYYPEKYSAKDYFIAFLLTSHYSFFEKIKYILGIIYTSKHLLNKTVSERMVFKRLGFKVPCLFIYGENDLQTPKEQISEAQIKKYSNIKKAVIIGSGHSPHLDNPEKFIELVKSEIL